MKWPTPCSRCGSEVVANTTPMYRGGPMIVCPHCDAPDKRLVINRWAEDLGLSKWPWEMLDLTEDMDV